MSVQPYKILIALDSFKGSMNALEACEALESGLKEAFDAYHVSLECCCMPLSDGGEGLILAFCYGQDLGEYMKKTVVVQGPYGQKVEATYLLHQNTAILEMAQSCALDLTPVHERRVLYASSYGLGEVIKEAYIQGAREIILGVGGSASNDGGAGCLQALGIQFKNLQGEMIQEMMNAWHIGHIGSIDGGIAMDGLKICILSDVSNPLLGESGASHVYGKQKGVIEGDIEILESHMAHFAAIVEKHCGRKMSHLNGSGAAGGVVFGLRSFCDVVVHSGAEYILDRLNVKSKIKQVDLVIVGEGQLDYQSAFGKAPITLCRYAHELDKPVIGVAGSLTTDSCLLHHEGLRGMFSLVNQPMSLKDAMRDARTLLQRLGKELGGILSLNVRH